MKTFILLYCCFQALFFLSILLVSRRKDRRLQQGHGTRVPPGFIKTKEVTFDPTTGKRFTVYDHPETGDRFYLEE